MDLRDYFFHSPYSFGNINKANIELKGQNNKDIVDSKVKKDDIQHKELGIDKSQFVKNANLEEKDE